MSGSRDDTNSITEPLITETTKENPGRKMTKCLIGYAAGIITMLSDAARVPILKALDIPQVLKLSWRMQSMIPFVLAFCLYDVYGKKI